MNESPAIAFSGHLLSIARQITLFAAIAQQTYNQSIMMKCEEVHRFSPETDTYDDA